MFDSSRLKARLGAVLVTGALLLSASPAVALGQPRDLAGPGQWFILYRGKDGVRHCGIEDANLGLSYPVPCP